MSTTENARDHAFRTELLLRELGYRTNSIARNAGNWTVGFETLSGFTASVSAAPDMRFMEIGASFVFSVREQEFIRQRMEAFLEICRNYGCYFELETSRSEIRISLFSKLYLSTLDYYALGETCTDLQTAAMDLTALFEITAVKGKGNHNGHP